MRPRRVVRKLPEQRLVIPATERKFYKTRNIIWGKTSEVLWGIGKVKPLRFERVENETHDHMHIRDVESTSWVKRRVQSTS